MNRLSDWLTRLEDWMDDYMGPLLGAMFATTIIILAFFCLWLIAGGILGYCL